MLHPNGQIPAYEWAFGDVNPPVLAMAALKCFRAERVQRGQGDHGFLARVTHKMLMNYAWWLHRKDADGNNVFEGGSLGLDNISVYDRSQPLPPGAAAASGRVMGLFLRLAWETRRIYGEYASRQEGAMKTARVFTSGNSQAIRLPKEFRFDEDEVVIKRVGHVVMLFPKKYRAEDLLQTLRAIGSLDMEREQPLESDRRDELE